MTSRVPEETWRAAFAALPSWEPPPLPTIIIAPHPDDETLGCGGLIAAQRRRGIKVSLVAVTDGEAAYPDTPNLAETRRAEQQAAVAALGVGASEIVRLGLPDGGVTSREADLTAALEPLVSPGSLLVAPWAFDPHADHEACGRASQAVAQKTGCAVIFYFFWAWHWFEPQRLAGLPLRRFEVDESLQTARAAALAQHQTQLYRENGKPVLPDDFLAPARRSFETFLVE